MHTFSHWRLCLNQPQWGQENNLLFIFHCFHADTAVSPRVKWTFIQQIWICKLKSESWCIYSCCYRLVMHCVTVFELSFCGCALCSVSQLYTLLLCWVLWSGPRTASKYFFKAEARKAAPVCLKINPSTAWFFFKSKLIQLKRYKKQQIKEKKKAPFCTTVSIRKRYDCLLPSGTCCSFFAHLVNSLMPFTDGSRFKNGLQRASCSGPVSPLLINVWTSH